MSAFNGSSWWKKIMHPPKYLTASILVGVAGLLNGLDTGMISPVTTMPHFVNLFGELQPAVRGIVVSSIMITATIASLFAGTLSDRLGRTRAVAVGALLNALGAALESGAASLGMFVAGRCILGLGQGAFLSTLYVYICEISPPKSRGILSSIVQVLICCGIMIGYFLCYGAINIDSSLSWRLPLAFQASIALFLAIMANFWLPESPRWLAYKGHKKEATEMWDKLGVSSAEREKELEQSSLMRSDALAAASVAKVGLIEQMRRSIASSMAIFEKSSRKPMFLGVFMMSMQQLSGIDGVMYYAPLLFQQAGISSAQASFLASGISAIVICVSTIAAFMLVDKWGRRTSTILGGLLLFGCMILIGSLYATNSVHATYGAGRWVVVVTIYVFAVSYCTTWALGVKLYTSEIQPVATRATATSLAQASNCLTNFFVAFITPVLLGASASGIYFLFGGCAILTVIVCSIYMPETRGFSLEVISERFTAHRVGDVGFMRLLKKFGSRIKRMIGSDVSPSSSSANSLGGVGSLDDVISTNRNEGVVEEVELDVLSARAAV